MNLSNPRVKISNVSDMTEFFVEGSMILPMDSITVDEWYIESRVLPNDTADSTTSFIRRNEQSFIWDNPLRIKNIPYNETQKSN